MCGPPGGSPAAVVVVQPEPEVSRPFDAVPVDAKSCALDIMALFATPRAAAPVAAVQVGVVISAEAKAYHKRIINL